MKKTGFLLFAFCGLLAPRLFAEVPVAVNFQGRLVDGTNLFSGPANIVLEVYAAETGGAPLYVDSNSVLVVDGIYSTFLGDDDTGPGTLEDALAGAEAWVQVVVDGTVLAPRHRLVSAPYALHARDSEQLGGLTAAHYATGTPLYVYTETDPLFSASTASGISAANTSQWSTAYGWGDHAGEGYLTAETDPVYSADKANIATGTPVYAETDPVWAAEKSGYATGTPVYAEFDPVFSASTAAGISAANTSQWTTAYSWGDHAGEGYLTAETDPVYSADKANIATGTPVYAETDPVWAAEKSGYATGTPVYAESDPVYSADKANIATGTPLYVESDPLAVLADGSRAMTGDLDMGGNSITNVADGSIQFADGTALSSTGVANWNTAYGWGDHGEEGYLTTETDPEFTASPAAGILNTDINSWNDAAGWGDHGNAGYLTVETDPEFTASPAAGISAQQVTDWDAAHGWGDHSTEGYLTSESDPLYSADKANIATGTPVYVETDPNAVLADGSRAMTGDLDLGGNSITNVADGSIQFADGTALSSAGVGNWNAAYGWGDHGEEGYLTTETDPLFSISVASVISVVNTSQWSTAYGWGDHGEEGYLTAETDPLAVLADGSRAMTGDLDMGGNSITNVADGSIRFADGTALSSTGVGNWNTAYGWGDHGEEGYLTAETDPVYSADKANIATGTPVYAETDPAWAAEKSGYATGTPVYAESDPVFSASTASAISAADTSEWSQAYGWGDHASAGYAAAADLTAASNSLQSQVNAKLDSNTWAAADSTTNSVKKTGDTMTGTLTVQTNLVLNYSEDRGFGERNMLTIGGGDDVEIGNSANGTFYGVAVGQNAKGYNYGVALGHDADGHNQGVAAGEGSRAFSGVAVGYSANGDTLGAAVGCHATGNDRGTAVGSYAHGSADGAAIGYYSYGFDYGAAIGREADGSSYGVAMGYMAKGAQTNIAVGSLANSQGGSQRIAIGNNVTNLIDDSAAIRGTLYLDGGTGIFYRTAFGDGTWTDLLANVATGTPLYVESDPLAVLADGSRAMTGDLDMGGNSITNVADGSIRFADGTALSSTSVGNWNTAYGWGNHASAGYAAGADLSTASNSLQTQVNAKLATATWSAADSTTNYVMRTGDTMSGPLTVQNAIVVGSNTVAAATGMIRFNPASTNFEGYTGTEWVSLTPRYAP